MTILFDSTTRLRPRPNFGAGLSGNPAPARRRPSGPQKTDELFWMAFTLAAEGENPITPTGLTAEETIAWNGGLERGQIAYEAECWADYDLHLEREEELAAMYDAAQHEDGPSDQPRWAWGGHPGFEE